jgi:hypothetical protein
MQTLGIKLGQSEKVIDTKKEIVMLAKKDQRGVMKVKYLNYRIISLIVFLVLGLMSTFTECFAISRKIDISDFSKQDVMEGQRIEKVTYESLKTETIQPEVYTNLEEYTTKTSRDNKLQLCDAKGQVVWEKSNLSNWIYGYFETRHPSADNWGYNNNSVTALLLANMDVTRYVIVNKDGRETWLPENSAALYSNTLGSSFNVSNFYIFYEDNRESTEDYPEKNDNINYFKTGSGIVIFKKDGTEYRKIELDQDYVVTQAYIDPQGTVLIYEGYDKDSSSIVFYSLESNSVVRVLTNPEIGLKDPEFSPSGDLVATDRLSTINHVFNTRTGEEICSLDSSHSKIHLTNQNIGYAVMAATKKTVIVVNLISGRAIYEEFLPDYQIQSIELSDNGIDFSLVLKKDNNYIRKDYQLKRLQ